MHTQAISRLSTHEAYALSQSLHPGWEVVGGHHLKRVYDTGSFNKGLALVNQVGELADRINHHPDVYLTFKQVVFEIFSHKLGGLTEGDFDLAKQIDLLALSK